MTPHREALQEEHANRRCIPAPNIQVGYKVWLEARSILTTRVTGKLDWKHLRPYLVSRPVSPFAYESEFPTSVRIHCVQPDLLLYPVVKHPMVGERIEPPSSVKVDVAEEHHVSTDDDCRVYRNQ